MESIPTAYQGTVICTPIKDNTHVTITSQQKGRILKGKVVSVGSPDYLPNGTLVSSGIEKGNTIFFLSYEGDYDNTTINNQLYYFVKFGDIRGVIA